MKQWLGTQGELSTEPESGHSLGCVGRPGQEEDIPCLIWLVPERILA